MIRRPWKILGSLIKHPKEVFVMLLDIFQCSGKVLPVYNLKYPLVIVRAVRLLLSKGFEPHEALQLGLLEPDLQKTELSKFISKVEMVKIQKTYNPVSWKQLTDDKSIFYTYCKALGLPVPQLYAIFFRHTAGHSANGQILSSREEWRSFINRDLPSEFIIKPGEGSYGKGIKCFSRTHEGAFIESSSEKRYSADDIYDFMSSYLNYNSFVIQERLINHSELKRLSDTDYLQTIRVLAFVDRKGCCKILHAFFKPIVGKNIIDNHVHGETGNLLAEINFDTGILKPAVKLAPDVSGIKTVFFHPVTGISFEGFHLPLWDDVCRLVKDASLKFLPLRIIGWDIAVTPKGLYIIEGNFYADPPSFHKTADVILSRLNGVH